MTTIVVDTNVHETSLFDELHARLGDAVERRRLDVGDVQVSCGDRRITFERKTPSDWASSMHDGRLKAQRARAILNPQAVGRFVYLLEALHLPRDDPELLRFSKIRMSSLYDSVIRTTLHEGLPVFCVPNVAQAADLIFYAAKQLRAGGLAPPTYTISDALGKSPGTNKRKLALTNMMESVLRGVPGLGKGAAAVAATYPTMAALCAATENEIAGVKIDEDRRIGIALANKLYVLAHGSE